MSFMFSGKFKLMEWGERFPLLLFSTVTEDFIISKLLLLLLLLSIIYKVFKKQMI